MKDKEIREAGLPVSISSWNYKVQGAGDVTALFMILLNPQRGAAGKQQTQ